MTTPTQVLVRFPVRGRRQWKLTPTGDRPRAGAIVPLPWDLTPQPDEVTAGHFDLALLATDEHTGWWAWQIRDPEGRRRTVAVPASYGGPDQVDPVDYADLPDAVTGGPQTSTYVTLGSPADVPVSQGQLTEAAPWMVDVLRDLARRAAAAEALTGTPPGMDPIAPNDEGVSQYLEAFKSTTATEGST